MGKSIITFDQLNNFWQIQLTSYFWYYYTSAKVKVIYNKANQKEVLVGLGMSSQDKTKKLYLYRGSGRTSEVTTQGEQDH